MKFFHLKSEKMDSGLKMMKIQDKILTERIKAQKKYKISSTPTILINEKKYEGKDYIIKNLKNLKKNL